MAARASASGGKRISQNEFTEKAWQSIIAAPDIAQNASQQMVDTEHLFKALLEQPNGLARRILAKAGSNPTQLLEKTDQYIRQQPRVTGDSSQVPCWVPTGPLLTACWHMTQFTSATCNVNTQCDVLLHGDNPPDIFCLCT